MSQHSTHTESHGDHVGHHVPMWILIGTLVALLVLTFITVAATWVDFGPVMNLWIALIIATVKAILVAMFFMHLAYDRPFNALILVGSLLFVMLFISLSMMDSTAYKGNVQEYRDADPAARYAPLLDDTEAE